MVWGYWVSISRRGHGPLSKNTNSNPDLITLKLKNKQTKHQNPQTTVGLN